MQTTDYLAAINAPGVNVLHVEWMTFPTPAARHKGHMLQKVTTATVMTGVEYAGLSANNDRETGELPWGTWKQYPYVVEHKGRDYFRLNTIDGTLRTIYLVDGDVVDRRTFLGYLTPSAAAKPAPHAGTVTIKAENVRLVGAPTFAA